MPISNNETIYSIGANGEEIICIQDSRRGYFQSTGEHSLEFVLPVMMLQVFLAFFVSRLLYYVLRPLKQPKIVCNVLVCFSQFLAYSAYLNFGKILFNTIFFTQARLILSFTNIYDFFFLINTCLASLRLNTENIN